MLKRSYRFRMGIFRSPLLLKSKSSDQEYGSHSSSSLRILTERKITVAIVPKPNVHLTVSAQNPMHSNAEARDLRSAQTTELESSPPETNPVLNDVARTSELSSDLSMTITPTVERGLPIAEIQQLSNALASLPSTVKITIVDSEAMMQTFINHIRELITRSSSPVLTGFDMEWRPCRKKKCHTLPAIIQVALPSDEADKEQVFLMSLEKTQSCLPLLEEYINSPHVYKCGFGCGQDMQRLRMRHLFSPNAMIDVGIMASEFFGDPNKDTNPIGMVKSVALLFGQHVWKGTAMSNWDKWPLTTPQQHYAALDGWLSLRCVQELQRRGAKFSTVDVPQVKNPCEHCGKEAFYSKCCELCARTQNFASFSIDDALNIAVV